MTFASRSNAASFNERIIPKRSSRKNALVVGSISSISSLADFTKSMNNSCILNGTCMILVFLIPPLSV